MKKLLLTLFLLFSTLYAQKKVITVTIQPQKYIIDKIAVDKVKVKTLFQSSNFEVKFKKLILKEIAASDIYMTIGLDIEKDFKKNVLVYNKKLEFFDMSKDIKKMKRKGVENPYVWTDPLLLRDMARTTFIKLSEMDPYNRSFYRTNYEKFIKELDELYIKIKLLFSNTSYGVYYFDDYWDYYLAQFDFPSYKMEKKVLSAVEISGFIAKSKKRRIKVVLAELKSSPKLVKSIASNSNSSIVRSTIFKYSFMSDLYILSERLSKQK